MLPWVWAWGPPALLIGTNPSSPAGCDVLLHNCHPHIYWAAPKGNPRCPGGERPVQFFYTSPAHSSQGMSHGRQILIQPLRESRPDSAPPPHPSEATSSSLPLKSKIMSVSLHLFIFCKSSFLCPEKRRMVQGQGGPGAPGLQDSVIRSSTENRVIWPWDSVWALCTALIYAFLEFQTQT